MVRHPSQILRFRCRGPFSVVRRARRFTRLYSTQSPSSDQVQIVEVGPRDGLQNEKQAIPLETKLELIHRLAETGLDTIEAGSFVNPQWVPQMAASSEILKELLARSATADEGVKARTRSNPDPITYHFLVPNKRGLDDFLEVYRRGTAGAGFGTKSGSTGPVPDSMPGIELSIFTSATETFSQKNTNCSIAQSLDRFKILIAAAKEQHPKPFKIRAYISVALGCPFEGEVSPKAVADLGLNLLEMGADEISIGDTTGMGTMPKTTSLLRTLRSAGIEPGDMAMHFHDTYGQALVNTVVSLEHGIRKFDGAVAGLGGCPYSPGATGNVATEDLVYLFSSLGLHTGVDLEKLAVTGEWISGKVGRRNESSAGKALLTRLKNRRETGQVKDAHL